MADESLYYLELVELTRRMHAKEISPVDATKAELDRIASLDKSLHSFALVTPEAALEQARQAESEIARGDIKGPLHGAPIAVKDLCWTTGVPTAAGMTIYRDFRPTEDATVVKKLRAAGAVILGKLQLTEGAFADHHPDITPPVNPWNAAHWSGASSSGSGVATAAGLCFGSLGSDTGGSIRFPSAANGVTGLKPTWGRVSRYGVFELAATLDHIGPMARSAVDTAAMLGVIAGPDENDPTASQEAVPNYLAGIDRGVRGLRIGVDSAWNQNGTDARMVRAVDEAIAMVRGTRRRNPRGELPRSVRGDCRLVRLLRHRDRGRARSHLPVAKIRVWARVGRSDRSGTQPIRSGLPEDAVAPARFQRALAGAVRDHRPAADSRASLRLTDHGRDGNARPGSWEDSDLAPLHLSVRFERQPDHYVAVRFYRRWHAGCVSVRCSALPGGDPVPSRICLPTRDGLASPSSDAEGLIL